MTGTTALFPHWSLQRRKARDQVSTGARRAAKTWKKFLSRIARTEQETRLQSGHINTVYRPLHNKKYQTRRACCAYYTFARRWTSEAALFRTPCQPQQATHRYLLVDPEHVRLVGQQLGLLDAVIDACALGRRNPVGRDGGAGPQLCQDLGGALAPSDLAEQLRSRTVRRRKQRET